MRTQGHKKTHLQIGFDKTNNPIKSAVSFIYLTIGLHCFQSWNISNLSCESIVKPFLKETADHTFTFGSSVVGKIMVPSIGQSRWQKSPKWMVGRLRLPFGIANFQGRSFRRQTLAMHSPSWIHYCGSNLQQQRTLWISVDVWKSSVSIV